LLGNLAMFKCRNTACRCFGTGVSSASEQALRVCTCLRDTSEIHHQIIKKLIYDNRPVKNRDGGPIAGVAFNGGVSRQLGPDDNDPVSATHFPEASNHTIPPSPTQSTTRFVTFYPTTSNGGRQEDFDAQIPSFATTVSCVFSSNRSSEVAGIRER